MTNHAAPLGAIRMHASYEGDGKARGYRKSVAFLDETTREPVFSGEIVGHVARSRVEFFDREGRFAFSIKPNRIVLPTRWALRTEDGALVGTLVQKIFGRGFWAGLDAGRQECFRVVDPQPWSDKMAQQIFGGAVSRYALVQGDRVLGAVQEEKREKVEKKGFFGFLKTLVTPSDPLLRLEPEAAAALDSRLLCGLVLLLFEITVPLDRAN